MCIVFPSQANLTDIVHSELKNSNHQLLSARERNRAKRKAKLASRQVSRDNNGDTNGASTSSGEPSNKIRRTASVLVDNKDSDKLVIDNVPDNTLNMEEVSVLL